MASLFSYSSKHFFSAFAIAWMATMVACGSSDSENDQPGSAGATAGFGGSSAGTGGAAAGSQGGIAGSAAAGTGGNASAGTGGSATISGHGVYGFQAIAAFDALPSPDKQAIKQTKVFFAHQSVGQYMLEGSERIGFPFAPVEGPSFYDSHALGDLLFLDDGIDNGDATGKISGFQKWVNDKGIGDKTQVAAMKFCYSDIEDGVDLAAVEKAYQDAVTAIESAHPKLRVFHVTPPIEVADDWNVKMNKLRVQFGTWLIDTYKDKAVVFDLMDIESRKADGTPCRMDSTPVLCNENNWSDDPQHPNPTTQDRIAKAFLYSMYQASQ